MKECSEAAGTTCTSCGPDEFLGTWNRETHCHQHRYCDRSACAAGEWGLGAGDPRGFSMLWCQLGTLLLGVWVVLWLQVAPLGRVAQGKGQEGRGAGR